MKRPVSLTTSLRRLRSAIRALGVERYDVQSLADGTLLVCPTWGQSGVFDRIEHAREVADVLNALCRPVRRPGRRRASRYAPRGEANGLGAGAGV